jgi:hypothetical protein
MQPRLTEADYRLGILLNIQQSIQSQVLTGSFLSSSTDMLLDLGPLSAHRVPQEGWHGWHTSGAQYVIPVAACCWIVFGTLFRKLGGPLWVHLNPVRSVVSFTLPSISLLMLSSGAPSSCSCKMTSCCLCTAQHNAPFSFARPQVRIRLVVATVCCMHIISDGLSSRLSAWLAHTGSSIRTDPLNYPLLHLAQSECCGSWFEEPARTFLCRSSRLNFQQCSSSCSTSMLTNKQLLHPT